MISRFNREGAVTISDVLNSAPPLNDELPNLDYGFVKRDTEYRAISNPSRLTNPDLLFVNFHLRSRVFLNHIK